MSSRIEIEGIDELRVKLMKLPDKVKKKTVLKVLRKMALPYVRLARSSEIVPKAKRIHTVSGKRAYKRVQPGNLRKSIGTITGRKGSARENPTIYVGPRVKGKYDGWYGGFVHEGTKNGIKPNPYMERIFKSVNGMDEKTAKAVARLIQKEIDRL